MSTSGGSWAVNRVGFFSPTNGVPHMITIVRNSSANEVYTYANGTLKSTNTLSGTLYHGSGSMKIGAWQGAGGAGQYYKCAIWNGRALSPTEVDELWNNGNVLVYPAPPSINVTLINPPNNTILNDNTTINYAFSVESASYPLSCNVTKNNVNIYSNSSVINNQTVSFTKTGTGYGNHSWNVTCNGTTSNTFKYVINDTINPTITWHNPLADNSTTSNQNLTLNVTGFDVNLWGYEFNITNSTGTEICYGNNSGLSPPAGSYNLVTQCNFTTSDLYKTRVCFSDSHTLSSFADADTIEKTKDTLTYNFKEDEITIRATSPLLTINDFSTEKLIDRYTFDVKTDSYVKDSLLVIRVDTSLSIQKVSNSRYKGHYVLGNKYWIDFETEDADFISSEISGNSIIATLKPKKTDIKFNSLGGINIWCEEANYNYDITAPIITLSSPANASLFYDTTSINYVFIANASSNMSCNLTRDDVIRYSNSSVGTNALINYTESGVSYGNHSWNVTCNTMSSVTSDTSYYETLQTPALPTTTADAIDNFTAYFIYIMCYLCIVLFYFFFVLIKSKNGTSYFILLVNLIISIIPLFLSVIPILKFLSGFVVAGVCFTFLAEIFEGE